MVFLKTDSHKKQGKVKKPSHTKGDQGDMTASCTLDWVQEQKEEVNEKINWI